MVQVQASVIIPVHNHEVWIEQCIESVLEQPVELEVIVIDSKSTDKSASLVKAIASRDKRVRLVKATGDVYEQGLSLAKGKYVTFADASGIVPTGAYAALVAGIGKSSMAVGSFLRFSANQTVNPTEAWGVFSSNRTISSIEQAPKLLRTRELFNKLFEREFLVRNGFSGGNLSDVVSAYLAADSIAIVARPVFLARKTDEVGDLAAYLREDLASFGLLSGKAELVAAYKQMFFNSDGWLHLSRSLLKPVSAAEGREIAKLLADFGSAPAGLAANKTDAFALAAAGFANLAGLRANPDLSGAELQAFAAADFGTGALPKLSSSLVDSVIGSVLKSGATGLAGLVSAVAKVAEPTRKLELSFLKSPVAKLVSYRARLFGISLEFDREASVVFVHRATRATSKSGYFLYLPGYWDAFLQLGSFRLPVALDDSVSLHEVAWSGAFLTRGARGKLLPTLTVSAHRFWFALKGAVKRLVA